MNNTEHPIMRRHRLITGQPKERDLPSPCTAPDPAAQFLITAVNNLQKLAHPHLHIAPPRQELHDRLREAARLTKAMRKPSTQEVA